MAKSSRKAASCSCNTSLPRVTAKERLQQFWDIFGKDDDVLVLINADPDALAEALKEGRIKAGTDVFEKDPPLPEDHPLWTEPGLMLTPHIGGLSEQSAARAKILALFIRNLENWTKGDALESEVDLETGYRKISVE